MQSLTHFRYLVATLAFLVTLPSILSAQQAFTEDDYTKKEYQVEMRDGVKLHTTVYAPKDQSQEYPILMKRTPYSCRPYGEDKMPRSLGNPWMVSEGYIFVCQDVRGRWMSEGDYTTMTPNIPGPDGIDESSDTYDTVEWLINNIPNNNGNVGQWGISYPGFYTTAGLPDAHPALVASSPQAPISDFFFDDFHHHGAYLQSYWYVTPLFGIQHEGPTDTAWYDFPDVGTQDGYYFYKDKLGIQKNTKNFFREDNFFWNELAAHPNYDEFWQQRNILPHLKGIDHNVMVVGGWFDAEDLYGPLNTYKTIEKNNPEANNMLVMGPWSHGDWARLRQHQLVGEIHFGDSLSHQYQRDIEAPFFRQHLKGGEDAQLPEAYVFDTGKKMWSSFDTWPPKNAQKKTWYVHGDGSLNNQKPTDESSHYSKYVSDPDKPVPYVEEQKIVFTPRPFMTDDQRFAARRPDVLTFETEVLEEDVTLAGEILANLHVATTGTAADWVVKLIDVYPPSVEEGDAIPEGVELDNYHQMVRSEVIRGRFRNSYEKPEPFTPGKVTYVDLPLQDVYHTFKKGHKIQIQIQSTWFPYIDRNPQTYVENIFEADLSDFTKQTHRVYHNAQYPTNIEVDILK
jgi:putative CocE/NonD family hydrolase